MITLHQYPGVWGLTSLSPFCIKVEVFLKLAGLTYETSTELNPGRGPKGKMPFITLGEAKIADSSFIIEHLIKTFSLEHLSFQNEDERARFISLKTLVEESLYFVLLHSRWMEGDNYKALENEFVPLFPPLLGRPALMLIKRSLMKQANAQGIARHTQNEINRIAHDLIFSLNHSLGKEDYYLGNRVSALDATVYSFLMTILKQPFDSFLKQEVSKYPQLLQYTQRMELLVG